MSPLITLQQPHSPQAETYRALRGRLLNRGWNPNPHHTVIGITTPHDGVDTSTVCANLAVSVAQSGRTIALIETDLRQPSLASHFNLSADVGIANVLSQTSDDIEIPWQTTPLEHLLLLASGKAAEHPADLLPSPRMDYFLEHVRESAEVVLLHLPPIIYPEAAWLANRLDGVVLVAQRGRTRQRDLAQANDILLRATAKTLGAIFIK